MKIACTEISDLVMLCYLHMKLHLGRDSFCGQLGLVFVISNPRRTWRGTVLLQSAGNHSSNPDLWPSKKTQCLLLFS